MKTVIAEILLCFLMCTFVHVLDAKFHMSERILAMLEFSK